jgi:arylformamidase
MPEEPTVFLHYTQKALDDAYDQQRWAPNLQELVTERKGLCAEIRRRHKHFEAKYGEGAEEILEIVPAAGVGAPVLMFVHGGAWRPQPDNAFVWFADTIVERGIHFAAARFSTIDPPRRSTRLPDMVAELRRAVAWLFRNAASFGGDPGRIHVIGHSSGAHLTSVLLTTDWTAHGLAGNVLKSGTCVSGMYDLRPVLLSARSSYVHVTPNEEDELSAIRHVDRVRCPVAVAYGSRESPEFQRHGRSFSAELRKHGAAVRELLLEDKNHFEGIRTMMDAASPLARALFTQIGSMPAMASTAATSQ